jgi:hypothetical protein
LHGGDSAGTAGITHGAGVNLQGGTPLNGGQYGPVRLQVAGGGVVVGGPPSSYPQNASVALEFKDTDKAPRLAPMTSAQRDALAPVDGMFIYNSTTGKFQARAAGAWVDLH